MGALLILLWLWLLLLLWLVADQKLSCAFGARFTSLLLVQKRSNQEKMTPRLALSGHPCPESPWAGAGLFEGTSMDLRKGIGILPMPANAACRLRLTAAQGPRKSARILRAQSRDRLSYSVGINLAQGSI
jgi:hypothetical protein